MKNLEVIALIKFKAEQVSEILDSLKVLVEESRKEKGCIKYNLIEDIDTEGHFIMSETWESQDALDLHNQSGHFINFVDLVKEKNAEVIVYKGNNKFH